MATFVDPVADAAEAYEGLRGLAHATRAFEDPVVMYRVLGEVSGSVRLLRQVNRPGFSAATLRVRALG